MALNLIHDAWIPVRRRDGTRVTIAPREIADPNITTIDWPRADFRLAQCEFLIGLLATACPPEDDDAWFTWWERPPTSDELRAAFAPYAAAFELDGDGARFMQDRDAALAGDIEVIEALLLDTPGDETVKKNRDLMVRPGRFRRFGRAAAAIALYTLQTHAPSGGRGYRTSLRDGGPLTTLVLPGGEQSLWRMLWANVPCGHSAPLSADVFPWLAPTRVSPNGELTTPLDAHASQCWWGMPRRIRIVSETVTNGGGCDITGDADTMLVTGCVQVSHGTNYSTWTHPLTPYEQRRDGSWRACHPGGTVGYRHWAAWVTGGESERPADSVSAWRDRAVDLDITAREQSRLFCAGYECRQAAVLAFVESEMPLPGSADALTEKAVAFLARRLIVATSEVETALRRALGKSLANDADALWRATEAGFHQHLRVGSLPPDAPVEQPLTEAAPDWLKTLKEAALEVFDTARPLIDPNASDPARIVNDRRVLTGMLSGYGALGKRLYEALLLPVPKGKP
jgi:CRISPR system Cascade subunit CasA